ncbi:MAG TPA: DUF4386 domain-containing protein [Candidatus Binatia bacterium]|nr:DUF4386 domain-containing protein [Candidatus Binatia bacterium]
MTRTMNARIAGFTFLFYIGAGILSMTLSGWATHGEGTATRLASMAQHPMTVGVVVVLVLLQGLSALVLATTLYAITREQDADLAMLGLTCRVVEGVLAGVVVSRTLGLLWLSTAMGAKGTDTAMVQALGAFLFQVGAWSPVLGGTFFAVGSTLFSYLLLRGRMVPLPLAALGVAASALLVVGLPLRLAGFVHGPVTWLMWAPMAAFEVPLALWLLVKGVRLPPVHAASPAR